MIDQRDIIIIVICICIVLAVVIEVLKCYLKRRQRLQESRVAPDHDARARNARVQRTARISTSPVMQPTTSSITESAIDDPFHNRDCLFDGGNQSRPPGYQEILRFKHRIVANVTSDTVRGRQIIAFADRVDMEPCPRDPTRVRKYLSLQANRALSRRLPCSYFEVTVLEKHDEASIGIGLSYAQSNSVDVFKNYATLLDNTDPSKCIGAAIYSDHARHPCPVSYLTRWGMFVTDYGRGDVIGCGYVPSTGEVFFTINGDEMYKVQFQPNDPLVPTVASNGKCLLEINTGASAFSHSYPVHDPSPIYEQGALDQVILSMPPPPSYETV